MPDSRRKKIILLWMLYIVEGIIVGFGAILPGVSGGTLCAAFGMYQPAIETLTEFPKGLKKHGIMLCFFLFGGVLGFVGLSGLAAYFLEKSSIFITCVFIGLIVGTLPKLWHDAGQYGRDKRSLVTLTCSFLIMVFFLFLLRTNFSIRISAGVPGYLLCGILFSLSFIVPGLSSSSLLLFFELYQPMLQGIYKFRMAVLIPMGVGFLLCVLFLSKGIDWLYKKHFSLISHIVLGIVSATIVMIFPNIFLSGPTAVISIFLIITGACTSYFFTYIGNKINNRSKTSTEYSQKQI